MIEAEQKGEQYNTKQRKEERIESERAERYTGCVWLRNKSERGKNI